MPLEADLYLDRIDLARYAGGPMCQVCRVESVGELVERLRSGWLPAGPCPHWPPERVRAFRIAVDAGKLLPAVPSLQVPRPGETGLVELNRPAADAPVLLTGNSQLTLEVLMAVLSTTDAPMWLVAADTGGHTVDMAMVYRTFTAEAVAGALRAGGARPSQLTGRVILPGLAASLADPVAELFGRPVEVGPICAAELPLFFGESWWRSGDAG